VDTPHFERLAEASVLFENAFCTAPQCSPSRAAIVTGRYPHSNGVMGLAHQDYAWSLNAGEQPAARLFGAHGYQTWLLGLQHETWDASALGFERIDWGFGISDLPAQLESALEGRDPVRPFYCQLGSFETHRPWTQPGFPSDSSLGITVPAYLCDGPETREEVAAFQGMVRHFDQGLGVLLEVLEQQGAVDDTILVVTTDHGIAMPMAKSTLRDPGLETLLLMRYPRGGWPAGQRISSLVSNVDILPTLLAACGFDIPDTVQGTSFLPLLQGQEVRTRDALFAEKTFHDCYDPMRCVRTEKFKYIRYFEKLSHHPVPGDCLNSGASRELGRIERSGFEELYDLEQDPQERRNLAEDAAYAQVCRDMRARLAAWMQGTGDPLLRGPVASPFYEESIGSLL
jgi:arylsulfatase A-like enzyme